jgi:hypothetical protein
MSADHVPHPFALAFLVASRKACFKQGLSTLATSRMKKKNTAYVSKKRMEILKVEAFQHTSEFVKVMIFSNYSGGYRSQRI